jgi:hypothetical protein
LGARNDQGHVPGRFGSIVWGILTDRAASIRLALGAHEASGNGIPTGAGNTVLIGGGAR